MTSTNVMFVVFFFLPMRFLLERPEFNNFEFSVLFRSRRLECDTETRSLPVNIPKFSTFTDLHGWINHPGNHCLWEERKRSETETERKKESEKHTEREEGQSVFHPSSEQSHNGKCVPASGVQRTLSRPCSPLQNQNISLFFSQLGTHRQLKQLIVFSESLHAILWSNQLFQGCIPWPPISYVVH